MPPRHGSCLRPPTAPPLAPRPSPQRACLLISLLSSKLPRTPSAVKAHGLSRVFEARDVCPLPNAHQASLAPGTHTDGHLTTLVLLCSAPKSLGTDPPSFLQVSAQISPETLTLQNSHSALRSSQALLRLRELNVSGKQAYHFLGPPWWRELGPASAVVLTHAPE